MKKLLITIDFRDPSDKFWWDCSIKNKVFGFDPEKQTIHELVKEICEEEGMTLTYKGKPKGNIYREYKDKPAETVGYLYRGKSEIQDRNMVRPVMVFWDVWVEIRSVEKFEIQNVDNC